MTAAADPVLIESFERMLRELCTPQRVRAIEAGEAPGLLWEPFETSGFLDALVAEAAGGAGLRLAEAFELFLRCGRWAVPVPLAQTMLARAVTAAQGARAPAGPIAIAAGFQEHRGQQTLACRRVPYGLVASWVIVPRGDSAWLMPAAAGEPGPTGVHASLQADFVWRVPADPALVLPVAYPWREAAAAVTAATMAGAMERVLQESVRYAGEREQFGRPIGRFQAIQQQISVMAEQTFAACMAAEIGCQGVAGPRVRPLAAAAAKARCSEAAAVVAAIAHAVHGAIGITYEYDLQLWTRRLQEWRLDFGSEDHWNARVGTAVIAADAGSTLEFLLSELGATGD